MSNGGEEYEWKVPRFLQGYGEEWFLGIHLHDRACRIAGPWIGSFNWKTWIFFCAKDRDLDRNEMAGLQALLALPRVFFCYLCYSPQCWTLPSMNAALTNFRQLFKCVSFFLSARALAVVWNSVKTWYTCPTTKTAPYVHILGERRLTTSVKRKTHTPNKTDYQRGSESVQRVNTVPNANRVADLVFSK